MQRAPLVAAIVLMGSIALVPAASATHVPVCWGIQRLISETADVAAGLPTTGATCVVDAVIDCTTAGPRASSYALLRPGAGFAQCFLSIVAEYVSVAA